tara:strand:+ start:10553 stop:10717 length:165 start_codon:yes stop_codon:yes gene_type:complete
LLKVRFSAVLLEISQDRYKAKYIIFGYLGYVIGGHKPEGGIDNQLKIVYNGGRN